MTLEERDIKYMRRALQLAELGNGSVSPNPMVGAVLVHADCIIGEGWHQKYGGPHAEVHAISQAESAYAHLISAATLYVTLEPCHHFGKTPPCVDLVLRHQIGRVVIAHTDPNPLTAGKSVEKLRAHGVEVVVGVLEQEARWLNRAFIHAITTGTPYIILKWAETTAGVIGHTRTRLHVSSAVTQRLVHCWRAQSDAILVGKRTAVMDNPRLDLRLAGMQKQYLRIAWCAVEALAQDAHLLDDSQPTWLLGAGADAASWQQTQHQPIDSIDALLELLMDAKRPILLVEGGAQTLHRFLEGGHWNEIRRIVSPIQQETEPSGAIFAPDMRHYVAHAKTAHFSQLGPDRIQIYAR